MVCVPCASFRTTRQSKETSESINTGEPVARRVQFRDLKRASPVCPPLKVVESSQSSTRSKAFCINVLRAEDSDLSNLFSGALSGEGRFKSREWSKLATGSPVLLDALVSFDCRVIKKLAHGTHTIFLGQVAQVLFGKKGRPLLYAEGQYSKLASLAHGEPLPEGLDYWGF